MSSHSLVIISVSFYFLCSLSLVFLNKTILSGGLELDAAVFLTWTQILVTVVVSWILCKAKSVTSKLEFLTAWEYKLDVALKLWPVTFAFCGMVIFNNLCLQYVEVTFYQIARSLTIVFNIIISFGLYREKTSIKCMLTCAVIVVGYILGVDGEVKFSMKGVVYGLTSSGFVSLYSIVVKRYMKSVLNDDSWLLLYYNNVNSMILMPFISIAFGEFTAIKSSATLYTLHSLGLLFIAGLLGTLMNVASFFQIKFTSALTHNVSGTAKACVQSILAWFIYRNPMSEKVVLGLVLSIFGSFLYSKVKFDEQEDAKKLKELSHNDSVDLKTSGEEEMVLIAKSSDK